MKSNQIITEDGKLKIFENFKYESKYKTKKEIPEELIGEPGILTMTGTSDFVLSTGSGEWVSVNSTNSNNHLFVADTNMKNFFRLLFKAPLKVLSAFNQFWYSPDKFFRKIKHTIVQLKSVEIDIDAIDTLIEKVKASGQESLKDILEDTKDRLKLEYILAVNNFDLYVTEQDIVELHKYLDHKKLRLDWLKNFTRLIPSVVEKEMNRAIELDVFDNFVILHYDPESQHSQLTKKEIEEKKDPILFGVIGGKSRRLYFIGDWIDEYCDLTLDDIVSATGNKNRLSKFFKDYVK